MSAIGDEVGVQRSYPSLGDILDNRFKLISRIGENDFSVFFKAQDDVSNEYRMLKVFGLTNELKTGKDIARAEAKHYKALQLPCIPAFFKIYEKEYMYLEMEFIESKNLRSILDQSLDYKDKILYAYQLAEALSSFQQNGIEHCHISPDTIFINSKNKLYLLDYGYSSIIQNFRENELFVGNKDYCPPESRHNEEKAFARDIFAYGVVLYELFYGKYPFEKDTTGSGRISYRIPTHIIDSNSRLNRVIKKCLQYYFDDRYHSFETIISDLNELIIQKKIPLGTKLFKLTNIKPSVINNKSIQRRFLLLLLTIFLICSLFFFNLYYFDHFPSVENIVEIETDINDVNVFINSYLQDLSKLGNRIILKKGDLISLVRGRDFTEFEMTYSGEKRLKIGLRNNRVYVNNKLRGIHTGPNIKIPPHINFLLIQDTNIDKYDLAKLTNKDLHLALTNSGNASLLAVLPPNTVSLSMRNHNRNINLEHLYKLDGLRSLDLSGAGSVDLKQFQNMPSLEILNLQNTRTSSLVYLRNLPNLVHINLSNNRGITDLSQLTMNTQLQSINLTSNGLIENYDPLVDLPYLQHVYTNNDELFNNHWILSNHLQKNREKYVAQQQKLLEQQSFSKRLFSIAWYSIFSLLFVQIIFFLSSLRTQKKSINPKVIRTDDVTIKRDGKVDTYRCRRLDSAVMSKRLFYPENNNALFYLNDLIYEFPSDEFLQTKKAELLKFIENSVQFHLKNNEYEPVYLASIAMNEYFPSPRYHSLEKKAKRILNKRSKIKMVKVSGGNFLMGDFINNTNLVHKVQVHSFRISETTVTNQQYCDFLNSERNKIESSYIKTDSSFSRIVLENNVYVVKEPYASFPVCEVSWHGASKFCEWMGGRLPTEAEWEFAARSRGKKLAYATGKDINRHLANGLFTENDEHWHSLLPVKSFASNDLGLYEMSGNILEWCYDWFDTEFYQESPDLNPKGPVKGDLKVVRGGAWCFGKEQAATYYRNSAKPSIRNNYTGFRVLIPG